MAAATALAWGRPTPALGRKDATKDEEGGRETEGGEPSAVGDGARGHHTVACGARSRGRCVRTGVHSGHTPPGAQLRWPHRRPRVTPGPAAEGGGSAPGHPAPRALALPRAAWGCASEQRWRPTRTQPQPSHLDAHLGHQRTWLQPSADAELHSVFRVVRASPETLLESAWHLRSRRHSGVLVGASTLRGTAQSCPPPWQRGVTRGVVEKERETLA